MAAEGECLIQAVREATANAYYAGPMLKAALVVLLVGQLEAWIAFIYKAAVDPIGTRWQVFVDNDAWWMGLGIGWFLGLITVGAGIAYADWMGEFHTTLRQPTERREMGDADRHRFW